MGTQTITDLDIRKLQWRNAERLKVAKQNLGTAYLLHPSNRVSRTQEGDPGLLVVQRQLTFFGTNNGSKEIPLCAPSKGRIEEPRKEDARGEEACSQD